MEKGSQLPPPGCDRSFISFSIFWLTASQLAPLSSQAKQEFRIQNE